MDKEVIITITPAGTISIDAQGFEGCGCTAATESIELVLGGAGQKKKSKKPEFYSPVSSTKVKTKLTF